MVKADIVKRISEQTGLKPAAAREVVEIVLASVKGALVEGDTVYLRGFGTFERKRRKAKPARDMKHGLQITLPARDIPHFRASREFREQLNDAGAE